MTSLQLILKRIIDFVLALIALVVFSPIIVITSICILVFDGFPILFKQTRPGLNEKIFNIYKFRTMRISTNENQSDGERLTAFGKFLRKTSLDELPQLLNVLKGDLSLVGPRPLLVEYLPLYNEQQKKRHSVKPGITGWAQINGRNAISWKQKFDLDIWYVNHWSILLDFKILFMTFGKVLKRTGINANENTAQTVTMEKFNGNN